MPSANSFESDIERCTNEKNTAEDWNLILDITERVSRSAFPGAAKDCVKFILKRLRHRNPHVAMQTLTLLDACVNNCGKEFLHEISCRDFINEAKSLLVGKQILHPKVANRFASLVQKWATSAEFQTDKSLDLFKSFFEQLKRDHSVNFEYDEAEKPSSEIRQHALEQEEEDIVKAIAASLHEADRKKGGTGSSSSASRKKTTSSSSGGGGGSGGATSLYPSMMSEPIHQHHQTSVSSSDAVVEPRKVRALYDFEAAEDNELTFKTGEIILVLDDSDQNWWKGSNHRGEGLFPSNFVSSDLNTAAKSVKFMPEVEIVSSSTAPPLPSAAAAPSSELAAAVVIQNTVEESKIDECLALLENANPTGDSSADPPQLGTLEEQCRLMGPLIDQELEKIDRKHMNLSALNLQLMEAFQMYNGLMSVNPIAMAAVAPHPSLATASLNQAKVPIESVNSMIQPPNNLVYQPVIYPPGYQSLPPPSSLEAAHNFSGYYQQTVPVPFPTGPAPTAAFGSGNVGIYAPPSFINPSFYQSPAHIPQFTPQQQQQPQQQRQSSALL